MVRCLSIRKKLVTGLVLVLAISAVLTTNTLIGLYSYRNSIKAFDSQMQELVLGERLWKRVANLDRPEQSGSAALASEPGVGFLQQVAFAEEALSAYRARLQQTLRRGRDPDQGKAERALLSEIEDKLRTLRALSVLQDKPWASGWPPATGREGKLQEHVEQLDRLVARLPVSTSQDMEQLVGDARSSYSTNLWIGWFTGILVAVMILVLSRLSYYWIIRPVRQLHSSVRRVGHGDLSHRILLPTGDEMQELAEAFNDMTGRLQGICQDLEHQVEERSRQLVRSEQLASVGFLAAGVSHEINNPLASISLSAESLGRRLECLLRADDPQTQEVRRYLAMIQSEAFRCKAITERLLDFSRMRDHARKSSELSHLVADVIDVVRHMGRYREKNLVLQCPSSVVAEVNPQELKQVVLNLVVNALESMDSGGTLEIDVGQQADQAELVFSDDGCGMAPDVLENIFEPFFTRSRTGRGTGLGLSISHRIVTDHGGQIEAASEGLGKGSRFTVRLPLVQTEVKEDSDRERIGCNTS